MVASYRYLGVSNPGLLIIGSNECDVSYLYGTRLQPMVNQYKPIQHQTFAIEKIPRFDRNNPIMSWRQKNLFFKEIGEREYREFIFFRKL